MLLSDTEYIIINKSYSEKQTIVDHEKKTMLYVKLIVVVGYILNET